MNVRPWRAGRRKALVGLALVIVLAGVLVPNRAAQVFTDVGSTTTHAQAITVLSSQSVVSGYPDGSFRPSAPTTRMQFAKILARALQLPVSSSDICGFIDVPRNLDPHDSLYPDQHRQDREARQWRT